MSFVELFLLAAGLAMDAAAVAASKGCVARPLRPSDVGRMAALFGAFQALMPAIGWVAGARFAGLIGRFDHWIAFGLLGFLGGKMIREGLAPKGDEEGAPVSTFELSGLLVLAVATSIDALAVGVTLPMFAVRLGPAALVIGLVTFASCVVGAYAGRAFGARLGGKLDVTGGVVLVGIGAKILVEHLVNGT